MINENYHSEFLLRAFLVFCVVKNPCVGCRKALINLIDDIKEMPFTCFDVTYQKVMCNFYYSTYLMLNSAPIDEWFIDRNDIVNFIQWLTPKILYNNNEFSVWCLMLFSKLLDYLFQSLGNQEMYQLLESLKNEKMEPLEWNMLLSNLRCGFRKV